MNAGVEILLGRMESHPEEFQWDNGTARWDWLMRMMTGEKGYANEPWGYNLSFLPDEEIQALTTKFKSIQGEAFTRSVMRELLVDDEGEKHSRPKSAAQLMAKARALGITNPEA